MILANYSQINRNTGALLGSAFTNPFALRNMFTLHRYYMPDEANSSAYTGRNKSDWPNGYGAGYAYHLAPKAGGLGSVNNLTGAAIVTGAISQGINLASTINGVATMGTPSLSMVVSLAASLAGAASVTASAQATLALAASLAGTSSVTAGLKILAQLVATINGAASVSANLKGKLSMEADIQVNQSNAEAAQIANAVWSAIAEGSYTHGQIMQILAAVAAGKTTITDLGGGDAEVTIRDLNDTADRVFAEMTGSERTTVTVTVD